MKKNMYDLTGKKVKLNVLGGATPTCYGDKCDILTKMDTCFLDDHKITECNEKSGSDNDNALISNTSRLTNITLFNSSTTSMY